VRNKTDADLCRSCKTSLVNSGEGEEAPPESVGDWSIQRPLPGSDNPYLFIGRNSEGETALVRCLTRSAARDRVIRGQFLKEAELLEGLSHPHLVSLREKAEVETGVPALVLGSTGREALANLLRRKGRLPLDVALVFASQIASGLEFLHENRVTHRMLTPHRMVIGPADQSELPVIQLLDLGFAHKERVLSLDELEFGADTLMGMRASDSLSLDNPIPYQAPEALDGESDERTDLYSLGIVLFEMLTGQLPFSFEMADVEVAQRIIREKEPTDIRLLRGEISDEFKRVISTLLAKDPDDRFQSVESMRTALELTPEGRRDGMVPISGGAFLRGSTDEDEQARDEEKPAREITLSAFYIDRVPVTASEYYTYAVSAGVELPEQWYEHNDPEEHPDRPVVYVNWDDAQKYADWAGKRLPSEAEWEKAARGTDGRLFPWGNQAPTNKHAWFGGVGHPADVTARPFGKSPYGVHEMAGNVFEWVHDWFDRDYYQVARDVDPTGPDPREKRSIRGGSYAHDARALRCAARGRYKPEERRANHGFRCVWSLED
jgi:serine/threonine-protein kinase